MTAKAKIHIEPSSVIGEVHDHFYGANLEHVGQTVYGGHWAEMLRDRKFAGMDPMYVSLSEGLHHQSPAFGVVVPWEPVNPHPEDVLFVHDNTTFYSGQQSQRITIRWEDGKAHGIQQAGLFLEQGREYQVRLVLQGDGHPAQVRLGDAVWEIPAVAGAWTTYERTLTPGESNPNGVLAITFQGEGHLWVGCASVMPADHLRGHRRDLVEALKEWRPTFLRWPGGNFVSGYHWMDGIGDRDRRPTYLDPAWNLLESNDVGTDEFMDLCELIGSEPVLTVNMGNGTADEAAAWVEYCNGDASTEYGARRAANGHPEPYNVRVWFVGNEQFGNWQVGHCDAETYARRYLEFAAAMRAVDPDLLLIGVGVPNDLYGHWNELVLKHAGQQMDEFSVHYYSIRTEKWDKPPEGETLYLPKVAASHEVAQMLDRTLEIIAAHSDPPVPLAFDEWNTYVGARSPGFIEDYNLADALYAGGVMNACIHRCDRVKMTAIFNLINVMANYRVTPEYHWQKIPSTRGGNWVAFPDENAQAASVWKLPTTLVLELLTHHRGPLGITCRTESPVFSSPATGNLPAYDAVPLIDAAATYDPQQQIVYLSVVNRDAQHAAQLDLSGITRNRAAQIYTVTGAHPLATNTEEKPDAVGIEQSTWQPGSHTLQVPAHSFTLAAIPVDAEGAS